LLRSTPTNGAVALGELQLAPDVKVGAREARFDRRSGQASYTFTLTNQATQAIAGPLYLVLASITPGSVNVAGADDVSGAGDPVFVLDVAELGASDALARTVIFNNPARLQFSFAAAVYRPAPPPANTPPRADAGQDRTVLVGDEVRLDGSGSSDVDGDSLRYAWSFRSMPAGSAATLIGPQTLTPSFAVDLPGTYVVQLVVTDGQAESAADAVSISTQNSPPVADAGPDLSVRVGELALLDGSASRDADGDPLAYRWTLLTKPGGSAAELDNPLLPRLSLLVDRPGSYEAELVVNDGVSDSAADRVVVSTINSRPAADAGPDLEGYVGEEITLDGSGSRDADLDLLTYRWSLLSVPPGSAAVLDAPADVAPRFVPDVAGTYVAQLIVDDGALASDPDTSRVSVIVRVPPDSDGDGLSDALEAQLGTNPNAADSDGDGLDDGDEVNQYFTRPLEADTDADGFDDGVEVAAGSDPNQSSDTPYGRLPPDPSRVAPALSSSAATSLFDATAFLYTGPTPIQTGVALGTIESRRVAVIRGRVRTRVGEPLPGVRVSVLAHPELGETSTRFDGAFDFAVNGGGPLTLQYRSDGYLEVQRQVDAPWEDYASADDVVMVPFDADVTAVDLAAGAPLRVARGSAVTDTDGTRRATVLFPPGTEARMILPDGSSAPLGTLHVRATEYTVGASGLDAMPAALPPTSGYTYAVELSVDEAQAAGAAEVRFSTPVPFYVENFLRFPVGIDVPLGGYDRAAGVWRAADSGRVIAVVGVTNGVASLDVNGDGTADGATALAALAITDAERAQLASLYSPGQSLWRVRVPHFSAWDVNWGIGPPGDAVAADVDPEPDLPCNCQDEERGSIIGVQNQTLGEAVAIVGTPFTLRYQSERTPGNKAAYSVEIPLSGSSVPSSLARIELEVFVAGQAHAWQFASSANQRTTFTWNAKDGYGRTVQGAQPITVRIGYTYAGVYEKSPRFGYNGAGAQITGSRARREVTLWRTWQGTIGGWDARSAGLGGWTLSEHHVYDPVAHVLYRGDGGRQGGTSVPPIIATAAGGSSSACGFGDGGAATQAGVCPRGLATGPEGSLYIVDLAGKVRRVSPDGIITTVAGTGAVCSPITAVCGDGGPATQARFVAPRSLAVGLDGSVYVGDVENRRVRRIGPDGIITTVAGTGVGCASPTSPCGDGGLATLATVAPAGLAIAPDGSLYIADGNTRRVRRVGLDGVINTVAGTGGLCSPATAPCGDGGSATLAGMSPVSIAVGRDGSLYISDASLNRVRRVTPGGVVLTIAGTGAQDFSGDGGPAKQATFRGVGAVAAGRDGTIFVFDAGNRRVRSVRPNGTIDTLAGNGQNAVTGDGGAAGRAALLQPDQPTDSALAIGPDASVYVAQSGSSGPLPRVRRIWSGAEGLPREGGLAASVDGSDLAAAADGSEVYVLAPSGRHLRTVDGLTGALRYEFGYDAAGRLARVVDGDGNVTTIERDGAGSPAAIIGPFGQRTPLSVSADGFVTRVTNPAGEAVGLGYDDGLLTALKNPRGDESSYRYDPLGRLVSAADPIGATKTLDRVGSNRDYTVALTDALGRATTHRVEHSSGVTLLSTTSPATGPTQFVVGKDGIETSTLADGTIVRVVLGPDPRWGMQAPVATSTTITTPGGEVQTTTRQRAATLAIANDLLSLSALTETTTVNGHAYTRAYAAATRTVTATSPEGRRSTATLDDRGRLVQAQMGGLDPTSYTYDDRGRLATVTEGAGAGNRVARVAYGADGFPASVTDPAGRTTDFTHDIAGRVTDQTLPGNRLVRFAYDVNGNLTAVTPPGRPGHAFTYSARNEVATYAAPTVGTESSQTRYTYGADRQPTLVERPDGQPAGYEYDAAGRLGRVDLVSGTTSYDYDVAGRVSALSSPGVSLGYTYDGALLTGTSWSGATSGSVSRTYDNDFRITTQSVDNANPIDFQYDSDGLLTRAGLLALTRHAQSGLVTQTTLGSVAEVFGYNGLAELTSHDARLGSATLYGAQYVRDSLGRLTRKTETVLGSTTTFDYGYDSAGRLSEVRREGALVESYTYDANGNRLSAAGLVGTPTYDAQDRLIQYGAATRAYTLNGELQSKTSGSTSTAYRYDGLGNLIGATLPGGIDVEYLLDGQGRRVGKNVAGTRVQGFLYQDGLRPIAELDGSGAVVSRFVYGSRANVPDYLVKNGVTYRIISDRLGSPRLVVRADNGAVVQQLDYDAFGKVSNDTQPGFQPFGFAGGLYDEHTGLVHFGAREYDAEVGRWTRKDPIGFGGGDGNLYGYVLNDPVNRVDPPGLKPLEVYPLEEDAAREALRDLAVLGAKDAGGWIYKVNGGYLYLPPVSLALPGGQLGRQKYYCAPGFQPTALYHGELSPRPAKVIQEWADSGRDFAALNKFNLYFSFDYFDFGVIEWEFNPGMLPDDLGPLYPVRPR